MRRTEQRYQFTDNFSLAHGHHSFKWGGDFNHLPITADFTVNFGGLFNIGELSPSSLGFPSSVNGHAFSAPSFSPVQAYGLGIPQSFVQGIGNPHDSFTNNILGGFLQDSWRVASNVTVNAGVRYDVEFTPTFAAINALSQTAQDALGITQGIPRDYNNVAPRIGVAWDPTRDGKTAVRASYGLFYDHPLLGLAFDSDVADGTQAPQLIIGPGAPSACNTATNGISGLNSASNVFQGLLSCLPANFGYLANEQRFNASQPNSVFVNENFLTPPGVPLGILPFGFPTAKNFIYPYSNQANLTVERDLGHDFALSVGYNFNGGRHLNRPINANPTRGDLLVKNWRAAVAAGAVPASTLPIQVGTDSSKPPCLPSLRTKPLDLSPVGRMPGSRKPNRAGKRVGTRRHCAVQRYGGKLLERQLHLSRLDRKLAQAL